MAAEADSDVRDIEELCLRLLGHPHPEGPTSVELFARRLPELVAADLPLLPDWRLLGSALYSRTGRPTLVEVVVDAPNSFAELVGPFQDALAAMGWTVLEPTGPMHGGFVSADLGQGQRFAATGEARSCRSAEIVEMGGNGRPPQAGLGRSATSLANAAHAP